jgi:putative FmdB family regulatory protein
MPKYDYVCDICGKLEEQDAPNLEYNCKCSQQYPQRMRRIYSLGGIVFKGNGFYRTDSRGNI